MNGVVQKAGISLQVKDLSPKLAMELGAGLSDVDTLKKRYQISDEQWEQLRVNPTFRAMVKEAMDTFDGDLNPFDIDNDGLVELPLATDPTVIDPAYEYDLSLVFIHTITHEMAHALAGPSHTNDPACLMYRYSVNWSRQDYLSDYYKSLLRIHNIVR